MIKYVKPVLKKSILTHHLKMTKLVLQYAQSGHDKTKIYYCKANECKTTF